MSETIAAAAKTRPLHAGPASLETTLEHALVAQLAEDFHEAFGRWRAGRLAYPDSAVCWASELAMLRILDRNEEAENVVRLATERFPGCFEIAVQALKVAIGRKDWEAACLRLRTMTTAFAAEPYVRRNRYGLGETIASGLRALGPDKLQALAEKAEAEPNWPLAADYWAVLFADNPDDLAAVLGYGRALRHSNQIDRAEPILRDGIAAHPGNVELVAHYAEIAASRRDWPEAARRWSEMLSRFPDVRIFDLIAVTALREAREFDRAEALLEQAIAREPEKVELRVHHAILAERQEDWAQAAVRWDLAHRLRPDDLNIQNSRGDAIWQEQATRLEKSDTPPAKRKAARPAPAAPAMPATPAGQDDPASMKRLALKFEGLGDHCEFGIVQRRLGADPIGLFRFAAIAAETLTTLLDHKLAELGDPDFTELGLTAHDEYLVRDTRGLYHMHTFVSRGTVDEAKFLRQQVMRLGYLKKKLIEDLEEGQKVFVHKSSHARISDDAAIALHSAIERYGRNILLVIRVAEEGQPAGSVAVVRDRILVGHVAIPSYTDDSGAIDLEAWRSILAHAENYRAQQPAAEAPAS